MAKAIHERLGLTKDAWEALPTEEQDKLKSQLDWTTKPCDICGKDVAVLNTHEGKTWCLEHRGKWGQES